MRARRLEDRIRELCKKIIATEDEADLSTLLAALQIAIHELIVRLRLRAAVGLTKHAALVKERRRPPL